MTQDEPIKTDANETYDPDELVTMGLKVPRDLKDRVVGVAGGPRKVSQYVIRVLEASFGPRGEARVPTEEVDLEAREPRVPRESEARVPIPTETVIAWPSREEMLDDLFGKEFMEKISARCKETGKGQVETIRQATLAAFEAKPPTRRVGLPTEVELETAGKAGCKHDWMEPVRKFGRLTSFCKKDDCNARRVFK